MMTRLSSFHPGDVQVYAVVIETSAAKDAVMVSPKFHNRANTMLLKHDTGLVDSAIIICQSLRYFLCAEVGK